MSDFVDNKTEVGNFIKKLREQCGLTQKELAEKMGYNVRQIERIESGSKGISKKAMSKLSTFFNVDLYQYTSTVSMYKSSNEYSDYIHLRKLVETQDYGEIKLFHDKICSIYPNFKGEFKQLIIHADAVLSTYVEADFIKSVRYCFDALQVFEYSNYISSLKKGILTEMSYPVLNLLSYNYAMLEENALSNEIASALYEHFENTVFNNTIPIKSDMFHMKKYYIVITNNLSNHFFENQKYCESLALTDKAISLSNEFAIHKYLSYSLELKFKNYYMLGDLVNSKKYYQFFKNNCEITADMNHFERIFEKSS